MKKIIGTSVEEIDRYPLDCFTINHLTSGLIGYFIAFWLFSFFLGSLSAVLLSYLAVILGGLIWEFVENIKLLDMKRNMRADSPINSLTDVLLVFIGGIIGCYCYITDWMFKIILIGLLVLAYAIARIYTEKNKKIKNPSKKPKI